MRTIKFRGQRKDNGEWVYGVPMIAHYDVGTQDEVYAVCIITGVEHSPSTGFVSPDDKLFIEVIPSTVGQFTGFHDKNGKEIYEFDKDAVGNVVEFANGIWCLNDGIPLYYLNFEIAGNIFNSPELLTQQ